ncbi:MAG: NAD(P)/FAD-dependent oxidoreductase [Planctomycetota bacterium]
MSGTEVLIIGGGPAGSTVAWALGRRGFDVTVMDKASFPRDKVCAGWITPAVVESVQLDLAAYGGERVLQPIHALNVGLIDGPGVTTRRGDQPISYGIRRCEFDDYLLRRSGARLRTEWPLRELRREGDGWLVNGKLRARLLVGAGGHFCPVARFLGARTGKLQNTVVAKEIEFEMTPGQAERCEVAGDVPHLLFCRDLRGYGWVFRKGAWLNVGLGRVDSRRLAEHVGAFRESMVNRGRIPADTPTRFRGHAYRLYSPAFREVVDDAVLLVGDAAGLAYPESGEGIRPAVESGLLAAQVVEQASGDYRAARLAAYPGLLGEHFGVRNEQGTTALLPDRVKRFLARRLLASEWFARRVVQERWFLHRHQPAIALA